MTVNNTKIKIAEIISLTKIRIVINKCNNQSLGVKKIMIANNNYK